MAWPGLTDFSEAVQNPSVCFRGTDLETAQVLSTPRGLPMVYSGSFACVYPVILEGQRFAVRCFTREPRGQQSRYEQLSNYLISVLLRPCPLRVPGARDPLPGQLVPHRQDGVGGG